MFNLQPSSTRASPHSAATPAAARTIPTAITNPVVPGRRWEDLLRGRARLNLCLLQWRPLPVPCGEQGIGQAWEDLPASEGQRCGQPGLCSGRGRLGNYDLCFAHRLNGCRLSRCYRQFDGRNSAHRAGIHAGLALRTSRLVNDGESRVYMNRPAWAGLDTRATARTFLCVHSHFHNSSPFPPLPQPEAYILLQCRRST